MHTRFLAVFLQALRLKPSLQRYPNAAASIAEQSANASRFKSSVILVAAVNVVFAGVQNSAAQMFPCTDGESCDYTLPPITDGRTLVKEADKFAIEVLGYRDRNRNGIPDFREKYRIAVNDCSTVSAQLDDILEQMGAAGVLNSQQALGAGQVRDPEILHAYNYVPEIGYIDVTPSGYGPSLQIVNQVGPAAILYPDGYPDEGEYVDPSYSGPLEESVNFQSPPPILRNNKEPEASLSTMHE